MKVNFKVPATDKLIQEEIEKIKKNVLKNIKDVDIGLGVVSNTDDVSIYKQDDKKLTTVEIILTTTKPLSGVTHSTTSHDIITTKDIETAKMETAEDEKEPKATDTQILTTESTDYTQSKETTTLPLDSTTGQRIQRTTGPLPDHTSINDVPFLSHLNKTVKDLIQDFHNEFEVTKDPFMDHDHLVSDFEHIKQHLNGMGHTRLQYVTSTVKSSTDYNESPVTPSERNQHLDLNLDANDTFDFTGLEFPQGNSSFKEESLNDDTLMINNQNITKSSSAFKFLDSSRFTNSTDNATDLDDSSKLGTSRSLNNSHLDFNFNDTWKSNRETTSKYPIDDSDTKPTTTSRINLARSTPIVTSKDITTVSPYKSLVLTTPSLQDLYQDFLWNFGARISTTSKPDIPFHDHTAHSSPHTEYQHDEKHGLSHSPMNVKTETIGPELKLTEHSHFNFHGLSLEQNDTFNETNREHDATHIHKHDETVPHHHFSFPTSLPVTPISTNKLFKGLKFNFDGLSHNSSVSQDPNGTLITTVDSLNQVRDPKKENFNETVKVQAMRELKKVDLNSLVTLISSFSSTYMEPESPFSTTHWNSSTILPTFSSEVLLSSTIQAERVLSMVSENPMDTSHLLTQKVATGDAMSSRPHSSYRTKDEQSKSLNQMKLSVMKDTQFDGIHNAVSEHIKEPSYSAHDKPAVDYTKPPLIYSSSAVLFEEVSISSKAFVLDDISFPQHLSFPEQRLVDHTLLKLPVMSTRPTLDASLSINHYDFNQLHELGAETHTAKSLNTLLQSDTLKRNLESATYLSSHSQRLVLSFEKPLDFDKTSVISSFTALSEKPPSSYQRSQTYDISKKSIYFPNNYYVSNDTDLFSLKNRSPEVLSNHLTDSQPNIKLSAYPSLVHLSTLNYPMSSQILSNELSNLPFHKPLFTQELKSIQVQNKGMDHLSSGKWIQPSKTVFDTSSVILHETVNEPGASINTFRSSSRIERNETYAQTPISSSSSIFVDNIKNTRSDIALNKKNPSSVDTHVYPDDITFPEQPWLRDLDISHTNSYTTLLPSNVLESSMTDSLNSKTHHSTIVSSHMSQGNSDIHKMRRSSPPATLASSSSQKEIISIGSNVEPIHDKEIGVFETNLPWDALYIKPTKSSLLDNVPSRDRGQRKHEGKSTVLHLSSSSDVGTRIHHRTPTISVYTVTHEPIVYLTIDTRPVIDSSLLIQPTPRVSLQATFFQDRKKLESLRIQGRRGVLKIKRGSDGSSSGRNTEIPTKVDVTTARPKLTAAQVAAVRRKLARLRAARMQNFRRRQNSLARMQSGITDNFPLRRQISGSNTATTLVGRGLNVNNTGRRSLQKPTAPPRTRRTTENPRQRIDRNRLFPGFNADNQFNRNFFNNMRWNG